MRLNIFDLGFWGLFFKLGSHFVAPTGLEFAVYTRLAWNSEREIHLLVPPVLGLRHTNGAFRGHTGSLQASSLYVSSP